MNPDDDAFVRALLACEEALAAGRTMEESAGVGAAADCLRLLTRAFAPEPLPHEPEPTALLGRFRLLRELGRGAFGVVHLAEDPVLRRRVALKVPHAVYLLSRDFRQRFLREARLAASLDHPHIVRVHEAGEDGGVCYIAAEYCPGTTLAERLAGKPQPADEAARIVATLARAVQHAHDRGIVHRDLKPGNILLASGVALAPRERDETEARTRSAHATPLAKIADFGLAKDVAADTTVQTLSGTLVGTPSYMAPEQAEGRNSDVGPAADVWALGAVLYECLVGRPPFQGATPLQTLEQVRTLEPVPPARLLAGLPHDLNTIALKCLEKEPARRYLTAAALADDLDRFLNGEPIAARPAGRVERAAKWARRNRAAAALVAVSALALLVVLVGGAAFTVQQGRNLERIREQKGIADNALHRAADNDYAMRVALADRELRDGQAGRALLLLDGATAGPRGWEFFHLRGLALGGGRVTRLVGHADMCSAQDFSPDGRLLATTSWDGTIRLWDADDGRARLVLRPDEPPTWVAFAADGTTLLGVCGHSLRTWDVTTGRERSRVALADFAASWAIGSPDRRTVAGCNRDGTLCLWDVATGKARGKWQGREGRICDLKFSPDGRLLASAGL